MGETSGNKAPPPRLWSQGRTHGFCGELNGNKRKATSSSKEVPATSPEVKWRTVLPPGLRAHPLPASTQRLVALPEPRRKTRLQRKALTHQPGFYSFPTQSALWARGKQGKRTYLAALRGRPRGPAAGEGTPRSHSPPVRSPHSPSLPSSRATHPAEPAPLEARGAFCLGAASIFQRQGPCLLPEQGSTEGPRGRQTRREAPRPRGGAFRRYSAVRLQVRARGRPSRPGLPPSYVLAELRRRTRSPRGK